MIDLNFFKRGKGDQEPDQDRELRDNIEQIRRKVQQRQGGGPPEPGASDLDREPARRDQTSPPRDRDADQPPQRQPAAPRDRGAQGARQQPTPTQAERRPRRERAPKREQDRQDQLPRGRDFREETEEAAEPEPVEPSGGEYGQTAGGEADGLPSPPQVKEIDLPDIEKGPLFITVKRFKEAMRTVSALQQFSRQMDAEIGSLENTLDRDQETRESFQDLIDNVREHRERIQTIIEP